MKQLPKFIAHIGFPAAVAMAFLVLLFSSPLDSKTTPKQMPSIDFGHGAFVSVDAFAHAFGVTPHATAANHKLTLNISGRPVVLTRLSSVIKIDQELYRMPSVLMAYNGHMYISEQAVVHIAKQFHTPIVLQKTDKPVLAIHAAPSPFTGSFSPTPKIDVAQNAANWTLKTVVIDPGHGGKDPGAIGHSGTHEKTIVLAVAKRLKTLLEKRLDVEVILTRDDDTFIPLTKRSRIAIQNGGKIFVSLHCNATQNRKANGVEVYFLSEAKTKEAEEVAKKENEALKFEVEDTTSFSLNKIPEEFRGLTLKLLTAQFLKESQDLAADIHNAIVDHTKSRPRGVKQANFYVMRGTMGQMPSVLVELGFISHHNEERQLKSNSYQKKMAEALYEGIKKFKQRYEQQLTADSS